MCYQNVSPRIYVSKMGRWNGHEPKFHCRRCFILNRPISICHRWNESGVIKWESNLFPSFLFNINFFLRHFSGPETFVSMKPFFYFPNNGQRSNMGNFKKKKCHLTPSGVLFHCQSLKIIVVSQIFRRNIGRIRRSAYIVSFLFSKFFFPEDLRHFGFV